MMGCERKRKSAKKTFGIYFLEERRVKYKKLKKPERN